MRTVRTAWLNIPRKLAGHDHAENLSGRRVQERADERGIRAFPLRDDERPHHAIKLHYHHGLLCIRRCGAWNSHGDKSLCQGQSCTCKLHFHDTALGGIFPANAPSWKLFPCCHERYGGKRQNLQIPEAGRACRPYRNYRGYRRNIA